MDKRMLKKVILGQLATELRMSVVIGGDMSEEDLARADEVQHELADEFERRAQGGTYSPDWETAHG
jgi:hypothetical protein